MKLVIVIPALNEEQSIESIILRTHKSIDFICSNSKVNSVSVVVVSDGSTDKTVEIASKHQDKCTLIVFEKNKGYGAAIKEGWASFPDADLLAFLDADGTCDPLFFVELCNLITEEDADIALGSRLNKNSEMPMVRRFGNKIFSTLLSLISSEKINDTASGMRVIRRAAIDYIMPLPDGLHFTPAMSARAILSRRVKIMEKDMPYLEREGESKLNIWKDGKRFLFVILENIALYVPYKIFNFIAFLFGSIAIGFMISPIVTYLKFHYVQEDMIYRFLGCNVLAIIAMLLLSISTISSNVIHFTLQDNLIRKKTILYYVFESKLAIFLSILSFLIGTLLVYNSVWHRITTGVTNEHWSRYITMMFFYVNGAILMLTYITNQILALVRERIVYLQSRRK
jgi:glycosyltransferase involved in cell wall biosynthesis